ncbi:MAG: hypothetical protein V4556_07435 [Bacteroidota bacterium]
MRQYILLIAIFVLGCESKKSEKSSVSASQEINDSLTKEYLSHNLDPDTSLVVFLFYDTVSDFDNSIEEYTRFAMERPKVLALMNSMFHDEAGYNRNVNSLLERSRQFDLHIKENINKEAKKYNSLFDSKELWYIEQTDKLYYDSIIKIWTSFINPTGSYKLDSETTVKDGDTYGYFGEAKIKLLDSSKIAVSLFVCKGALSYNSGSFIDTLKYLNNKAIYRAPDYDTSCKIIFTFSNKGVIVEQYQSDINFGCGFGHAVFADGFYKKTSVKIPVIDNLEYYYNGTNGILPKKLIVRQKESNTGNVDKIKKYASYVDSLRNIFSLRHELNDTAEALLKELELSESIGEGDFEKIEGNTTKIDGGFDVYVFSKQDSIFRILFSGGKGDAFVTKTFYYQQGYLVYGKMTIRQWKDQIKQPYLVEEYYQNNRRIVKKVMNKFPFIIEKSLIPVSLFNDGKSYFNLYKTK